MQEYVNKIVFLSPLDFKTRMFKRRDILELIKKARTYQEQNNQKDLIQCGFFYKNSESFLDMMYNPDIDNFPFRSEYNNDFTTFNQIKKDKYILFGEDETKYVEKIPTKLPYLEKKYLKGILIINKANHLYQGHEETLCDHILTILENKYGLGKIYEEK